MIWSLVLAAAVAQAAPGAPAPGPATVAEDASDPALRAATGDALRALGLTQGGVATVGLELNGRDLGDEGELALARDTLMIRADDLRRMRLRRPEGAGATIGGDTFVPLAAVPGLRFSVDAARQVLRLAAPVESFETTALTGRQDERRATTPAMPSAFLSYDLTLEQGGGHGLRALFLDGGFANRFGYFETTLLAGNDLNGKGAVRLDTSWVHDDPDGMRRLSLGDALTHGSAWSPQLRFGGIRFGTDFSLQPNYLTFPTPQFAGRAALPSNVELYVNNVLGYQAPVGQGPFTLNQVPVVAGAGHVALVVKDATGVERRIVSSFYVSTQMLREGLTDFSLEAGGVRDNYGTASFDYRRPFASAEYRRGIAADLTVEAHAEASAAIQSLGGGASTTYRDWGEAGASLAASNARDGHEGVLARAYIAHTETRWSLSAVYQRATDGYRQIGDELPVERLREVIQANAGVTLGKWGSVNAALAQIRRGDGTRSRVLSATFNHEFRRVGFLSAYLINSATTGGRPDTSVGLTFTAAIGRRTSAAVTADQHNQRVDLQRTVPDAGGWGYRLSAARGDTDEQLADVTYRGAAVDATAEISRYQGQVAGRVLASGSLVLADGALLPARRLSGSYAVVDVDGEKGVRVFQDNRYVATTDSHGLAVINQLRPYEVNRLSIEPTDVQLDRSFAQQRQELVPPARAAVLAHFTVAAGRAGTLVVQREDGRPVTAGAAVRFGSGGEPGTVGFDGEVFVPALVAGMRVTVADERGACAVTVPPLPANDILPRIGPLRCVPVAGRS